jgi:hypothetical protein
MSFEKEELEAITGNRYILVCPDTELHPEDISAAVDSKRFPGLKHSYIPCLWVETSGNQNFTVSLRGKSRDDISHVFRLLSDLIAQQTKFNKMGKIVMSEVQQNGQAPNIPAWFPIAGYASLMVTLLFLMVIAYKAIFGAPVPDSARMLLVFIIAIGIAAATSFLGGNAAAKGGIPLPFAKEQPIKFSVSGGIAAFVITSLIGYYVYGSS